MGAASGSWSSLLTDSAATLWFAGSHVQGASGASSACRRSPRPKRWCGPPESNVALISREIHQGDDSALSLIGFFLDLPTPVRSLLIAKEWNRSEIIEAFSHGAKGIITSRGPGHDSDLRHLCKALSCVHVGQVWANSRELNLVLGYLSHRESNGHAARGNNFPLSAREREIAQLLALGATNRNIAETLHISERTVKNHLASIFAKIGVSNRLQAALRLSS